MCLSFFEMADSREQRMGVKFCFLLGKTGTETIEMLKTAYKNDAIRKPKCLSGFTVSKKVKLMSLNNQPRSGRLLTVRNDENVLENRRLSTEEAVEVLKRLRNSFRRKIHEWRRETGSSTTTTPLLTQPSPCAAF